MVMGKHYYSYNVISYNVIMSCGGCRNGFFFREFYMASSTVNRQTVGVTDGIANVKPFIYKTIASAVFNLISSTRDVVIRDPHPIL